MKWASPERWGIIFTSPIGASSSSMVLPRSSSGRPRTAAPGNFSIRFFESTSGLPWVHITLEQVEALPRRLDRIATGLRQVDRRLAQLHLWDIALEVG